MPSCLQASLKKRMMRVWAQSVQIARNERQKAPAASTKVVKPPAKASAVDALLQSSKSAEADTCRHVSRTYTSTCHMLPFE